MLVTNILSKIQNLPKKSDQIENVSIGDIVRVNVLIKEGNKERVQKYEGTVISIKSQHLITVRRIFQGVGIEYVFSLFAPNITSLSIKRHSKVRQSKLFYLRNRIGKKAQLKNKMVSVAV